MSDLIKRSDAIKALDNAWINGTSLFDANEAVKQLKDLPSVDRPQGEWIKTTPWSYGIGMGEVYGYYQKCSNCGKEFMDKSNFCPNCGARMKGADDE